jgi:hypothetical protein
MSRQDDIEFLVGCGLDRKSLDSMSSLLLHLYRVIGHEHPPEWDEEIERIVDGKDEKNK